MSNKTENQTKKSIFINGGAGRVLASIPALEKLAVKGEDFIIVAEGSDDFFKNNKLLHKRTYHTNHKDLFKDFIKDSVIVPVEPYRNKKYYNQECNIAQGFDIEINGDMSDNYEDYRAQVSLTRSEISKGQMIVNDIKQQSGKSNMVVFQPFGSGVVNENGKIFDPSGRSITYEAAIDIIRELSKHSVVMVMANIDIQTPSDVKVGTINVSLREWASVIKQADHFVGCDSVGQHIAFGLNKPCTVIFGSTFPENVGYPGAKNYNTIDLGKDTREYSPIRISQDERVEMNNEECFNIQESDIISISNYVKGTMNTEPVQVEEKKSCSSGKCCSK